MYIYTHVTWKKAWMKFETEKKKKKKKSFVQFMEGFGTAVTVYLMARNDNVERKEKKTHQTSQFVVVENEFVRMAKNAVDLSRRGDFESSFPRCGKCVGVCVRAPLF